MKRIGLQPILMTTAAMVFGTLPLAFASNAGSLSNFLNRKNVGNRDFTRKTAFRKKAATQKIILDCCLDLITRLLSLEKST
jgi:hypothetical protein